MKKNSDVKKVVKNSVMCLTYTIVLAIRNSSTIVSY